MKRPMVSVRVSTAAAAFSLLLLGGCSPETSELSRVVAELDCEREGYPCTLGELPEAVWDEMNHLGMASAHLLNSGSRSLRELADELEAVPGVVEVQTGDRAIRFRVEGGRPVWVEKEEEGGVLLKGSGGGTARVATSVPAAEPNSPAIIQAADRGKVVSDGEPKWALFVAPYEWQFNEGIENQAALFRTISQYREKDGGAVVVRVTRSEDEPAPVSSENPGQDEPAPVSSENPRESDREAVVTLEHLRTWKKYDFVHLSTHGMAACDDDLSRCWTSLSVGKRLDPERILEDLYANTPGVTVGYGGGALVDTDECKVAAESSLVGGSLPDECREPLSGSQRWAKIHVTTDFFRAAYPTGLKKTIVFLDACQSMYVGDLAKVLGGPETYVLGWDRRVPANHGALDHLIRLITENRPTADWEPYLAEKFPDSKFPLIFTGPVKAEPAAAPPAASGGWGGVNGSKADLWARDLVHLMDPGTGEELENGATLYVRGEPGDSYDDELVTELRIRGMEHAEEARALPVRISVDGHESPGTFEIGHAVSDYLWSGPDQVDLGFDLQGSGPVDIEVSATLPSGEDTSWTYEDIRLVSAAWTLSVAGGPRAGSYHGPLGRSQANYDGEGTHHIVMQGADEDPRYAFVMLQPVTPFPGPGTYATSGGCDVEIVFFRMADALALGELPPDGGLCSGNGEESGGLAPYPPPSTITITEMSDEWIEGTVSGEFYHVDPVQRPERRTAVSLQFRLPRCGPLGAQNERCRGTY